MFDIGFSELLLVFVIGLVVLGPQRLPVAVRTVVGWIRAMRSLAANVQNELAQELKLQELQESLRKVEEASKNSLTPELKASVEELKQSAESMKRTYLGENEKADDEAHTIHNPLVKNPAGATPAAAGHQASAPIQAPGATEALGSDVSSRAVSPQGLDSETAVAAEPIVHVSQAASPSVEKPALTATATTESTATSILSSRAPASTTQPGEQR
ncbi:Sec-independent protein translocase protein TatB [Erwinia psidii]|uniref:Sec-independent protein translocase protein TatB n=1 Tax=Erwinia psidii TaxID=69224 RepID=A0A3N6RV48_9GAMM|nr:Sec-independent protein translocase protein TatB [Erwinia psidii]MCX8958965.1 Sec-independent protein translocase subunit TatB [Erwinia psidii]MCX8962835.1 Sec-independent protein translocase subunit TatB [Erwinia psidii]RQM36804.1 Sec-independent protein translocase subunit TatB [Erwinia psidii]